MSNYFKWLSIAWTVLLVADVLTGAGQMAVSFDGLFAYASLILSKQYEVKTDD